MARDPFFSIKPSHSTFPFHSSLQASKQSKQERTFMTDQEKVECVICLEPLTSQTILGCCRQPCHQQCVNQWKNTCHTIFCPYCRQMIPIVVLDHRYNESWKKDKELVKKVKQVWKDNDLWFGFTSRWSRMPNRILG